MHRDEVTNELVKTFVDKVRRKKLTKIKRAVHKKRQEAHLLKLQRRMEREAAKQLTACSPDTLGHQDIADQAKDEDLQYETIHESDDETEDKHEPSYPSSNETKSEPKNSLYDKIEDY